MPRTSILENITKNKIKVEIELKQKIEKKMIKIKGENGRKLICFGVAFVRSS